MYSLNRVQLIGHLGGDPELRYTGSGKAVCNFNIATNAQWTDHQGVRQEQTSWHKVVVWDKAAEYAKINLHKGSYVYIEGRLKTRSWEDRDGNKKYSTEVVAVVLGYLEKKNASPCEPPPDDSPAHGDEDIPF